MLKPYENPGVLKKPPLVPTRMTAPTTFEGFASLGYNQLVPIVPPDAEISPNSTLAKRLGSRGKAVGVRSSNGLWHGFDWVPYQAEGGDFRRWQSMGAGVGIKTGGPHNLVAIDADTLDDTCAETIAVTSRIHFGVTPKRIGQAPKSLYLIRLTEPVSYRRIEFGPLNERRQRSWRVECLSDGRQFVAHGVHPKTNKPYFWEVPLIALDELPQFTPAELDAFLDELRCKLADTGPIVTEGVQTKVAQETLRGDFDKVSAAVAAVPNTSAVFGSRESYRDFGYAIKAALPDRPSDAFQIFSDWCARWQDGENDPSIVEADWRRMKPPFRRGAAWLYELAEEYSGGRFTRADAWFDVIEEEAESPFAEAAHREADTSKQAFKLSPTPFRFPNLADLPPRQWLYGKNYIRGFVSATVAPGGLGKSSLTIVEALAMASGRALLGEEPRGLSRVWLWNGEDPLDELERRIAAALSCHGLAKFDIGDRLLVDSGIAQPIILAEDGRAGARANDQVVAELIRVIHELKIDALIVDPLISAHRVNENDNGAIDLVAKLWARIAAQTNISIMLVHHTRKTNGSAITVEDARGASSLVNGARVARALTPMTKEEGAKLGVSEPWRFFRSGGVSKNNLAPVDAAPADKATWFTVRSVPIGNQPGQGIDGSMAAETVGVVTRANLATIAEVRDMDATARVLREIGDMKWRVDVRAGDWIGYPIAKALGLDASDKDNKAQITNETSCLLREGLIEQSFQYDRNRKARQFYQRTAKGQGVLKGPDAAPVDSVRGLGLFA